MNTKLLTIITEEFTSLLGHSIDPKTVRIYTLVKHDCYIGHRYMAENLIAVWYMDRQVVDFYDCGQKTLLREMKVSV